MCVLKMSCCCSVWFTYNRYRWCHTYISLSGSKQQHTMDTLIHTDKVYWYVFDSTGGATTGHYFSTITITQRQLLTHSLSHIHISTRRHTRAHAHTHALKHIHATYTHTHMDTHKPTHTHTHTHTRTHAHTQTHTRTHALTHTHAHAHTHTHTHAHARTRTRT